MAALRYKDVVMLRDIADEKGGYLSACGIVKPECCLSVPLTAKTGQADRPCFPDLREHFFEICPKMLYLDPATASPDMVSNQEEENENDLARFAGEPLKFGSVVQLRHLLTGKFVSVEKQRSGKIVVLTAGSELSHLRVWPALSSEQVGNLVRVNHLVKLLSISFDEGNLHATRLESLRRVQVSNQLAHSSFSIEAVHLHYRTGAESGEFAMKGSSPLMFFHHDRNYLTFDPAFSDPASDSDLPFLQRGPPEAIVHGSMRVNSNALWELQVMYADDSGVPENHAGAPLRWSTQFVEHTYLLCHTATRKFLVAKGQKGKEDSFSTLALVTNPLEKNFAPLWKMRNYSEAEDQSSCVHNNAFAYLGLAEHQLHNRRLTSPALLANADAMPRNTNSLSPRFGKIQCGKVLDTLVSEKLVRPFSLGHQVPEFDAHEFELRKLYLCPEAQKSDALQIREPNSTLVADLYRVIKLRFRLQQYIKTMLQIKPPTLSEGKKDFSLLVDVFQKEEVDVDFTCRQLVCACLRLPAFDARTRSMTSLMMEMHRAAPTVLKMMNEQHVIETLVETMATPFFHHGLDINMLNSDQDCYIGANALLEIGEHVYGTLRVIVSESLRNKHALARFMPFIASKPKKSYCQIKGHFKATNTVMECFKSNRVLLRDAKELGMIDLSLSLLETGLPRYLAMLSELSRFKEIPVRTNQNEIVDRLLREETTENKGVLAHIGRKRGQSGLFVSRERDGLQTNMAKFKDDSYAIMEADVADLDADDLLFRFSMVQLELFASLCIGRNRKAIDTLLLDAMQGNRWNLRCPDLIDVVQDANSPAFYRNVCLRLLDCLYMDREPLKRISNVKYSLTFAHTREQIRSTLQERTFENPCLELITKNHLSLDLLKACEFPGAVSTDAISGLRSALDTILGLLPKVGYARLEELHKSHATDSSWCDTPRGDDNHKRGDDDKSPPDEHRLQTRISEPTPKVYRRRSTGSISQLQSSSYFDTPGEWSSEQLRLCAQMMTTVKRLIDFGVLHVEWNDDTKHKDCRSKCALDRRASLLEVGKVEISASSVLTKILGLGIDMTEQCAASYTACETVTSTLALLDRLVNLSLDANLHSVFAEFESDVVEHWYCFEGSRTTLEENTNDFKLDSEHTRKILSTKAGSKHSAQRAVQNWTTLAWQISMPDAQRIPLSGVTEVKKMTNSQAKGHKRNVPLTNEQDARMRLMKATAERVASSPSLELTTTHRHLLIGQLLTTLSHSELNTDCLTRAMQLLKKLAAFKCSLLHAMEEARWYARADEISAVYFLHDKIDELRRQTKWIQSSDQAKSREACVKVSSDLAYIQAYFTEGAVINHSGSLTTICKADIKKYQQSVLHLGFLDRLRDILELPLLRGTIVQGKEATATNLEQRNLFVMCYLTMEKAVRGHAASQTAMHDFFHHMLGHLGVDGLTAPVLECISAFHEGNASLAITAEVDSLVRQLKASIDTNVCLPAHLVCLRSFTGASNGFLERHVVFDANKKVMRQMLSSSLVGSKSLLRLRDSISSNLSHLKTLLSNINSDLSAMEYHAEAIVLLASSVTEATSEVDVAQLFSVPSILECCTIIDGAIRLELANPSLLRLKCTAGASVPANQNALRKSFKKLHAMQQCLSGYLGLLHNAFFDKQDGLLGDDSDGNPFDLDEAATQIVNVLTSEVKRFKAIHTEAKGSRLMCGLLWQYCGLLSGYQCGYFNHILLPLVDFFVSECVELNSTAAPSSGKINKAIAKEDALLKVPILANGLTQAELEQLTGKLRTVKADIQGIFINDDAVFEANDDVLILDEHRVIPLTQIIPDADLIEIDGLNVVSMKDAVFQTLDQRVFVAHDKDSPEMLVSDAMDSETCWTVAWETDVPEHREEGYSITKIDTENNKVVIADGKGGKYTFIQAFHNEKRGTAFSVVWQRDGKPGQAPSHQRDQSSSLAEVSRLPVSDIGKSAYTMASDKPVFRVSSVDRNDVVFDLGFSFSNPEFVSLQSNWTLCVVQSGTCNMIEHGTHCVRRFTPGESFGAEGLMTSMRPPGMKVESGVGGCQVLILDRLDFESVIPESNCLQMFKERGLEELQKKYRYVEITTDLWQMTSMFTIINLHTTKHSTLETLRRLNGISQAKSLVMQPSLVVQTDALGTEMETQGWKTFQRVLRDELGVSGRHHGPGMREIAMSLISMIKDLHNVTLEMDSDDQLNLAKFARRHSSSAIINRDLEQQHDSLFHYIKEDTDGDYEVFRVLFDDKDTGLRITEESDSWFHNIKGSARLKLTTIKQATQFSLGGVPAQFYTRPMYLHAIDGVPVRSIGEAVHQLNKHTVEKESIVLTICDATGYERKLRKVHDDRHNPVIQQGRRILRNIAAVLKDPGLDSDLEVFYLDLLHAIIYLYGSYHFTITSESLSTMQLWTRLILDEATPGSMPPDLSEELSITLVQEGIVDAVMACASKQDKPCREPAVRVLQSLTKPDHEGKYSANDKVSPVQAHIGWVLRESDWGKDFTASLLDSLHDCHAYLSNPTAEQYAGRSETLIATTCDTLGLLTNLTDGGNDWAQKFVAGNYFIKTGKSTADFIGAAVLLLETSILDDDLSSPELMVNIACSKMIAEACQGPNRENQRFVAQSRLCYAFNKIQHSLVLLLDKFEAWLELGEIQKGVSPMEQVQLFTKAFSFQMSLNMVLSSLLEGSSVSHCQTAKALISQLDFKIFLDVLSRMYLICSQGHDQSQKFKPLQEALASFGDATAGYYTDAQSSDGFAAVRNAAMEDILKQSDANNDGRLSEDELAEYMSHVDERPWTCFEILTGSRVPVDRSVYEEKAKCAMLYLDTDRNGLLTVSEWFNGVGMLFSNLKSLLLNRYFILRFLADYDSKGEANEETGRDGVVFATLENLDVESERLSHKRDVEMAIEHEARRESNDNEAAVSNAKPIIDPSIYTFKSFLETNTGSVEIERNGIIERVLFQRTTDILELENSQSRPLVEKRLKKMELSQLLQPDARMAAFAQNMRVVLINLFAEHRELRNSDAWLPIWLMQQETLLSMQFAGAVFGAVIMVLFSVQTDAQFSNSVAGHAVMMQGIIQLVLVALELHLFWKHGCRLNWELFKEKRRIFLQNQDDEEEDCPDPSWEVYLDLVSTQNIQKFVSFEHAMRRVFAKDPKLALEILHECVLSESTFFLGLIFMLFYFFVLATGRYSMFIFNLLLVYRLQIGNDVFQSIQTQAGNLGKTLVVAVMTIFVFGAASFFNYRDSVMCESVLQCGSSAIKHSLTAESIQLMFYEGELTLPKWTSDLGAKNVSIYVFVIAFVLVWKFALQDISQGLIVDAYSEIRMNQREREHDALDRCFVCSRDRFLFEMESRGFDHHVKNDHNPFSYLGETATVLAVDTLHHVLTPLPFMLGLLIAPPVVSRTNVTDYFFRLHIQKYEELDGIQTFVLAQVQSAQSKFMPANRALCLEKYDSTHQSQPQNDKRAEGLEQKLSDADRRTEQLHQRVQQVQQQVQQSQEQQAERLDRLELQLQKVLKAVTGSNSGRH